MMDLDSSSATGVRKRRYGTSKKPRSSEKPSSQTARPEADTDNYSLSSDVKIRRRRSTLKPGSNHSSASSLFLLLCVISSSLLYIASYQFRKHRINNISTFDDASVSSTISTKFSSANAMEHVHVLGARMRWVGTHSLEESMWYIEKYLRDSIHTANKNGMSLHVERFQSGPGSYAFSISTIDLPVSYNNLTSVIALLTPNDYYRRTDAPVRDTLLINAHVDSAVGAPGASDNVVGVALSLEVFRSIINSPGELKRPLLFLFNGAEEPGLPGAHSFVTQKRDSYMKNVVAYINTESIGSGDSYFLFRHGPQHAWLAHAFSKSVSIPSTSSSANDVFESKLIPGETDFRVFNEQGGVPGFDFVFHDNGFIYHTVYDDVQHVSQLGLQHAGQTVLQLTKELTCLGDAIGKYLSANAASPSGAWASRVEETLEKMGLMQRSATRRALMFDVLHMFTVVIEEYMAVVIILFALILTIIFWSRLFLITYFDLSLRRAIHMSFVTISVLLSSLCTSCAVAYFYSKVLQAKLIWYGNWLGAGFVYLPPACIGLIATLLLLLPRASRKQPVCEMCFGLVAFYGAFLLYFVYVHALSAYIPLAYLLAVNFVAFSHRNGTSGLQMFVGNLILALPGAIVALPVWVTTLSVFLPLVGRLGEKPIPMDVIAAVIVCYFALAYAILPLLPLLAYMRRKQLRKALYACIGATFIGALFSMKHSEWNPRKLTVYSVNAPKRLVALHFHSPQLKESETGPLKSVLALGTFDEVKLNAHELERVMESGKNLLWGSGNELVVHPQFGDLNSTALEPFLRFSVMMSRARMYGANSQPRVALPSVQSTVQKVENFDSNEELRNVTIKILAKETHVVSVKFVADKNGRVAIAWSLESPVTSKGYKIRKCAWVRHVGAEALEMWIVKRREEKVQMTVTNCRLGQSRSDILMKLKFEEHESPMYAQCTGMEFVL